MKRMVLNGIGTIYLNRVYQQTVHALRNARATQEKLFKTFQRHLAGTALANDIQLLRYASFKDFATGFPPQAYDFYEPYVQRIQAGETRVMYHDSTEYYFVTSGTSGFNQKIIPCNAMLRRLITRYQQKVFSVVIPQCDGVQLTSDRFAYGSKTQHERILQAMSTLSGDAPVALDVPEPNIAAIKLAEHSGLTRSFDTMRMYRPAAPELPLHHIFGIASYEFG